MPIRRILPLLAVVALGCHAQAEVQVAAGEGGPVVDDETRARQEAAFAAAIADLHCPRESLAISATIPRRYSNTTEIAWAIDGCSQRALYAETCDPGVGCSDLMVAHTQLATPVPAVVPPPVSPLPQITP